MFDEGCRDGGGAAGAGAAKEVDGDISKVILSAHWINGPKNWIVLSKNWLIYSRNYPILRGNWLIYSENYLILCLNWVVLRKNWIIFSFRQFDAEEPKVKHADYGLKQGKEPEA